MVYRIVQEDKIYVPEGTRRRICYRRTRLGWYKIYYPVEFYAAYFTAAPDGFEAQTVLGGMDAAPFRA